VTERGRLLLVALGALALRLVLLVARGDYIIYDEAYYLLLARSLRAGHGYALNGLPHVALSPLQPVLVAALSLAGIPDLWASRLLAALAGAALIFPVAALARRWSTPGAALPAAVLVATAPALLAFVPFGFRQWSLYFGSEPLFLVLAATALWAAVHAVDTGSWRVWAAFGACAALAYLTRLEGAVLGVMTGLAAAVVLAATRRARMAPRALIAVAAAVVVALPYLLYLRSTLGRWAVSGRVQAATGAVALPGDTTVKAVRRDALQSFVWGGDREALWRALYALDPGGTRMRSQYWGVATAAERAASARAIAAQSRAEATAAGPPDAPLPPLWRRIARALGLDLAWWLIVLGLAGVPFVRQRGIVLVWLAAPAATVLIPALLAYVEPRAFLLVVPIACVLGGAAIAAAGERLAPPPRTRRLAMTLGIVLLLLPPLRSLELAWPQDTPLQRAATARRVVGEYLAAHLPDSAPIVAWHPAVALWAGRPWRVLPYDSLSAIMGYARAQGAAIAVFTTLEPSPLRDPPRAFTALLVDSAAPPAGANVGIVRVDETPLIFVGRIRPDSAR
jgi:4-amino-4-deoxy-L-arabinose transferase-like glycosyltransferase